MLAREQGVARLQRALALIDPAREALTLNATEELTLEALAYRIAALPRHGALHSAAAWAASQS